MIGSITSAGGSTTVYVYDAAGEVDAEYSATPPPETGTLYLTPDYLGSTRLMTKRGQSTRLVGCHDYLPFRRGSSERVRWPGELLRCD